LTPPALLAISIVVGKNGKAFVFGEIHGDPSASGFIGETISTLRKSGARIGSLALEVPADAQESFMQAVDDPKRYPGDSYEFESNGNRLSGLGGFISLARQCREMGMDVHCVDAPRRPGNKDVLDIQKLDRKFSQGKLEEEEYVRENQDLHQRRNGFMADRISSIGGGVAVVVGMYHTGGPGGLEEHLREKGMSVSTMDVYPKNASGGSVEIFARHENPPVDVRAASSQPSPTTAQVGALISNLRGMGTAEGGYAQTAPPRSPSEGFSVGPLRKGLSSSPSPAEGIQGGYVR
jgi:hypothetical protein